MKICQRRNNFSEDQYFVFAFEKRPSKPPFCFYMARKDHNCSFQQYFFLSVSNHVFSFSGTIRQACNVMLPTSLLAMSGSYAECSEMFPLFSPFQSASNPCEKNDGRGPCSHLCLINYNRTASCTCPHLMKLSPNKQSCFGEPEHPPHFSCSLLYVIKVVLYHTM